MPRHGACTTDCNDNKGCAKHVHAVLYLQVIMAALLNRAQSMRSASRRRLAPTRCPTLCLGLAWCREGPVTSLRAFWPVYLMHDSRTLLGSESSLL